MYIPAGIFFFTDSKLANACSLPYHSATSAFLKLPFPASKAQPKTKSCGSLLTSQSNMEKLKQKEKEKEEKKRVQEEKRLERERKKAEKANLKRSALESRGRPPKTGAGSKAQTGAFQCSMCVCVCLLF